MEINSNNNNYSAQIPDFQEPRMVYGIYTPPDNDSEDEFIPEAMAVYGIKIADEAQKEQQTGLLDKIKNFFSGNK